MVSMSRQAALDVKDELISRRHWSHTRVQKPAKEESRAAIEQANLEEFQQVTSPLLYSQRT